MWRQIARLSHSMRAGGADRCCRRFRGVIVTEIEFCLRTGRALLPTKPDKAAIFLNRVLAGTLDPRLKSLVAPVLSMIDRNDLEAAGRWLDRALKYDEVL